MSWILKVASGLFLVSCAFWAKKALLDYPEADMRQLFRLAASNNVGAGLALLASAMIYGFLLYAFVSSAHAADVRTFIPVNAATYAPMLKGEQARFWVDHPRPELLAGLVEQESCVSLTSPRCWSPTSSLKGSRKNGAEFEEGAGLGQITKITRKDGSTRFDSLAAMRTQHPVLSELSWSTIYQRPDLQLRAIVLMNLDNYKALAMIHAAADRLAFTDAAYNGGARDVRAERMACGLKSGCDPQKWFGNVETTCVKSQAALYGQRSACDINRQHVQAVMQLRSAKYRGFMT